MDESTPSNIPVAETPKTENPTWKQKIASRFKRSDQSPHETLEQMAELKEEIAQDPRLESSEPQEPLELPEISVEVSEKTEELEGIEFGSANHKEQFGQLMDGVTNKKEEIEKLVTLSGITKKPNVDESLPIRSVPQVIEDYEAWLKNDDLGVTSRITTGGKILGELRLMEANNSREGVAIREELFELELELPDIARDLERSSALNVINRRRLSGRKTEIEERIAELESNRDENDNKLGHLRRARAIVEHSQRLSIAESISDGIVEVVGNAEEYLKILLKYSDFIEKFSSGSPNFQGSEDVGSRTKEWLTAFMSQAIQNRIQGELVAPILADTELDINEYRVQRAIEEKFRSLNPKYDVNFISKVGRGLLGYPNLPEGIHAWESFTQNETAKETFNGILNEVDDSFFNLEFSSALSGSDHYGNGILRLQYFPRPEAAKFALILSAGDLLHADRASIVLKHFSKNEKLMHELQAEYPELEGIGKFLTDWYSEHYNTRDERINNLQEFIERFVVSDYIRTGSEGLLSSMNSGALARIASEYKLLPQDYIPALANLSKIDKSSGRVFSKKIIKLQLELLAKNKSGEDTQGEEQELVKYAEICKSLENKSGWMMDPEKSMIAEYIFENSEFFIQSEDDIDFVNQIVEAAGINSLSIFKDYKRYAEEKLLDLDKRSVFIDYAQKFNAPQSSKDPALRRGYKILGDDLTFDSYISIRSILDGSITDEAMQGMNITQKGENGLVQLESSMRNFTLGLTSSDLNLSLLQYKIYSDFFKSYVRYETSSWGNHGSDNFDNVVQALQRVKDSGMVSLDAGLPSSGLQEITRINRSPATENTFTDSFLSRYGTLTSNIQKVLDAINQPRSFSGIARNIKEKIDEQVLELQGDLEKNRDKPQAQTHIQKRIDKLRTVNPSDVKSFQANFSTLAQEKVFNDLLMQSVFAYTLKKFPEQRERMTQVVNKELPDVDSISAVLDFTGHMTTKEAWESYFTDKNARRAFQNILDTKEVEDGLSRLLNSGGKPNNFSSVEFTPTRGILMEFSGNIADACWASKYSNIAEQFPNITAVIIQDVSKEVPKPLGSSLLIETTATDGTPLLIIRGLNPLESFINHVDIPDFYSKYTEYVKRIAESKGRKAAIVIDGHSGGAATNRPLLFNFLNSQQANLESVRVSPDDTTFNGYNISNNTYLL